MSVIVSILLAVRPTGTKTRYRVAYKFDYKDLPFYLNSTPSNAIFAHFNFGDSNLSDVYFANNRSLSVGDIVLFHDNSGAVARVDGFRYDEFASVPLTERDIDEIAYVHPECHNTVRYVAGNFDAIPSRNEPTCVAPEGTDPWSLCNENFGKTWAENNGVSHYLCNYANGHGGDCSPFVEKQNLDIEEQAREDANGFW